MDLTFDDQQPPKIQAVLREIELDDADIIEGLEFLEPTPRIDAYLSLTISHQDEARPLPTQVGKFLSDTLGSFDLSSSGTRRGDDGRQIPTETSFSIGVQEDIEPAVRLIRETLWWGGASADTTLEPFPLELEKAADVTTTRFLQLALPKIERWRSRSEPGHRIDRLPFSKVQRKAILQILNEVHARETTDEQDRIETPDGGHMYVYSKYLKNSNEFHALNPRIDILTPALSELVRRLLRDVGLMFFPMACAASEDVARRLEGEWPPVTLIPSPDQLHEILRLGPYHWWSNGPPNLPV